MKAVVFNGMREVGVEEVTDAGIEEPTDVVLRITSSALCGTDPHMYDGRAEPSLVWSWATSRSGWTRQPVQPWSW